MLFRSPRQLSATLLILVLTCFASQPVPAESYRFRSYGDKEGLSIPIIRALDQDTEGYLWVATAAGVFGFDGERMMPMRERGMVHTDVRWIHATPGGAVWFRTGSALVAYELGKFRTVAEGGIWTLGSYEGSAIQTIASSANGDVWTLTANELHRWRRGLSAAAPERVAQDAGGLWSVRAVGGGGEQQELLAGCGSRICQWREGGGWTVVQVPPDRYTMIHEDAEGNVYARGHERILRRAARSRQFEEIGNELPRLTKDQPAPALATDFGGRLLTNTGRGIARFESGRWTQITSQQGLPSEVVRALLVDREGGIWVGSLFHGLARWLGDGAWRTYGVADGLPARGPQMAAVNSDGTVWVNTDGEGLYRSRPVTGGGGLRFEKVPAIPPAGQIASGRDGELVLGLETGGIRHYSITSGGLAAANGIAAAAKVNAFARDSANRLLAATNAGLFREETPRQWTALIPDADFRHAAPGRGDELWLTTAKGIFRWSEGVVSEIATAGDFGGNGPSPIYVSPASGLIWIGIRDTRGLGVYRFESGRLVRAANAEAPQGSGSAIFIFADLLGRIWAGGSAGLQVRQDERWLRFGMEQGLPGDLVFDGTLQPDGTAWFSAGAGLVRYDLPKRYPPGTPPAVVIREASSSLEPLTLNGNPRIPEGEGDLTVSFSVISTDLAAIPPVRYRLRPDREWRMAYGRRLDFPHLEPGDYRMEIAAQGRSGEWHSQPATFAFSVAAPFTQTVWFRLGSLAALGLAVAAFFSWRSTRERERGLLRLQAMIDLYPGGVTMLGADRRILLVNNFVAKQAGKPKQALLGHTPEEALGPALSGRLLGTDGGPEAGADSSVFDVRSFEVRDDGRGEPALCYFAADVTERARAEAARDAYRKELESAQVRYRSFVANSTEAIWRLEFDPPIPLSLPENEFLDACYERAIVAEANDMAGQDPGFKYRRLEGRPYREVRDRSLPVNQESDRAWYRAGCQIRDYMTVSNRPDGRSLTFLTNIYSVIENGCLIRSWGVQREITEKLRLEEMILSTAKGVSAHTGTAFFESLVEHLAMTLRAKSAYVAELARANDSDVLAIWADGRLLRPDEFPTGKTPCGVVLKTGRSMAILEGVAGMFPESEFLAGLGAEGYVGTPLVDPAGELIGVMAVVFDKTLEQPELVQSTLDIFAARASAEIQRVRAEEKLLLHERQLRALAARNLHLVEQERTRLAREIHDELGQLLTAIKIGILRIKQRTVRQEQAADSTTLADLNEAAELTDETARSVRRLARQLRPAGLDDLGLAAAIRWHAKETATRLGIVIDCDVEPVRADADLETAVFRLVQECLTNVARHARATHVEIRLSTSGETIELSVSDDGRGFDTAQSAGTLGLLGMEERAIAAGGSLTIRSAPGGGGTTVLASLPYLPIATGSLRKESV